MNIKDIVKDNYVRFEKYRHGIMYYSVAVFDRKNAVEGNEMAYEVYIFPVPLEDIGDATLPAEEKAIMFMRYIRKALDDGTFVRA